MKCLYLHLHTITSTLDGSSMIFVERDGSGVHEQAKLIQSREKHNSGDGKKSVKSPDKIYFPGGFVPYIFREAVPKIALRKVPSGSGTVFLCFDNPYISCRKGNLVHAYKIKFILTLWQKTITHETKKN